MKSAVIVFPGSNCDRDLAVAIEEVLDAPEIRRARPPDDAGNLVTLLEEQFGKVRAVLTGDPGDECALSHGSQYFMLP